MANKVRESGLSLTPREGDWKLLRLQLLRIVEAIQELQSNQSSESASAVNSILSLNNQTDEVRLAQSGSILYLGRAVSGSAAGSAVWQIVRVTYSSGSYALAYADGNRNSDNVWDSYLNLTYLPLGS